MWIAWLGNLLCLYTTLDSPLSETCINFVEKSELCWLCSLCCDFSSDYCQHITAQVNWSRLFDRYWTGIEEGLHPSQRFCQISQNPVKLLSDFTLPSQKTSNSADLWEHHQIIKTAKRQKNDRTSILPRDKAKRDCINQCHSLKLNWLRSFWHVLFLYLFFVLMLINVSLFFNIIPYLI